MKNMIPLLLYGAVLFGVSAGVGWYLRPKPVLEQVVETSDVVNPNAASIPDANLPGTNPTTMEGTARTGRESSQPGERLPTAVRTEPMTVEEIVSMSLSLKARQSALSQREDALQRTEAQHQLLMADLQTEQREIETLFDQSKSQKAATEELLKLVSTSRQEVDAARTQLEEDQKKFAAEIEKQKLRAEKLNQDLEFERTKPAADSPGVDQKSTIDQQAAVKAMAPFLENLAPEQGAETLTEMANNGNLVLAGQLIGALDEKKGAALLQAITDARLRNSLLSNIPPKQTPVRTARQR